MHGPARVDSPRGKGFPGLEYVDRLFVPLSLAALIVFPIVWIWKHQFLPMQDFPIVQALAEIITKYHSTPSFQEHLTLLFLPYPYLAQELVTCSTMFLGYQAAGKIWLSLVACVFLLSHVYFIRTVDREHGYVSLFAIPLIWNKFFFKGGYNYLLGLSFILVGIALLYKLFEGRDSKRDAILFPLACTLIYFSHAAALVLFFTASVPFCVYFILKRDRAKLIKFARAVAVPVLLFIVFAIMQRAALSGHERRLEVLGRLNEVISLDSVKGKFAEVKQLVTCFSEKEWKILAPLFGLAVVLLAGGVVEWRRKWMMLCVFAMFVLAYFVAPRHMQELVRPHERVLFLAVFLSPACMGFPSTIRRKKVISEREQKFFVAIICVLTAVRLDMHIEKVTDEIEPAIRRGYELVTDLPPNGKLLPVMARTPFYGQIGIGSHVSLYYVAEKHGVVPSVFGPSYTIVRYRNEGPLSVVWQTTTPAQYPYYDFIFVWGDSPAFASVAQRAGFRRRQARSFMATYERIDSPLVSGAKETSG